MSIWIPILLPFSALAAGWAWSRAHRAPWRGPPPDPDTAGFDPLHRYALHLRRQLRRQARDTSLPAGVRDRARALFSDLHSLIGAHPLTDDLRRAIRLIHDDPRVSPPPHPS